MSNSNLRPSAHGASIPGMAAPRGAPSAIPLPGEAELRSLLAPRLPSQGVAQSLPGAGPVDAETLALSGADAPGVGAVGARSNSNLRPSAHGASVPGMATPRGAPAAIPLPGEAELRALLTPRLASPVAAQPAPRADPAAAEALALSGVDAPGAGAVGARSNSTLRPYAHGAPLPATPHPSEAPMAVPPSAGYTPTAPGSSFYFLDESRRPAHGRRRRPRPPGLRCAYHSPRLSHSRHARARPAAGVVRQRGDHAEAQRSSTGCRISIDTRIPTCIAPRMSLRHAPPMPTRCARQGPRLPRCRVGR